MLHTPRWIIGLCLLSVTWVGCGPRPVPGGTVGVVRAGADSLSDIHVQLFDAAAQPVGSGVSDPEGMFALRQPEAKGPLWLAPGEYRVTVESVGPTPLLFPPAYSRFETTPLKVTWAADQALLELDLPMPKAGR